MGLCCSKNDEKLLKPSIDYKAVTTDIHWNARALNDPKQAQQSLKKKKSRSSSKQRSNLASDHQSMGVVGTAAGASQHPDGDTVSALSMQSNTPIDHHSTLLSNSSATSAAAPGPVLEVTPVRKSEVIMTPFIDFTRDQMLRFLEVFELQVLGQVEEELAKENAPTSEKVQLKNTLRQLQSYLNDQGKNLKKMSSRKRETEPLLADFARQYNLCKVSRKFANELTKMNNRRQTTERGNDGIDEKYVRQTLTAITEVVCAARQVQSQLINGVLLCYKLWNTFDPLFSTRIPIVLISDCGCVKEDWRNLITELRYERPVLAYDLRGIGQTGLPVSASIQSIYETHLLASDCAALIETLFPDKRPVFLLGVGLGGMVAQIVCTRFPKLVCGVILANTCVGGGFDPLHNAYNKVRKSNRSSLSMQPWDTDRYAIFPSCEQYKPDISDQFFAVAMGADPNEIPVNKSAINSGKISSITPAGFYTHTHTPQDPGQQHAMSPMDDNMSSPLLLAAAAAGDDKHGNSNERPEISGKLKAMDRDALANGASSAPLFIVEHCVSSSANISSGGTQMGAVRESVTAAEELPFLIRAVGSVPVLYNRPEVGLSALRRSVARYHTEGGARLEEVTTPTCVIAGDRGLVYPAECSKHLFGKLVSVKHKSLHILQNCGHLWWLTHRPEAMQAISQFAQRLEHSLLVFYDVSINAITSISDDFAFALRNRRISIVVKSTNFITDALEKYHRYRVIDDCKTHLGTENTENSLNATSLTFQFRFLTYSTLLGGRNVEFDIVESPLARSHIVNDGDDANKSSVVASGSIRMTGYSNQSVEVSIGSVAPNIDDLHHKSENNIVDRQSSSGNISGGRSSAVSVTSNHWCKLKVTHGPVEGGTRAVKNELEEGFKEKQQSARLSTVADQTNSAPVANFNNGLPIPPTFLSTHSDSNIEPLDIDLDI